MAPPVESWPAHELPDRVQVSADGRRRKDRVELEKCALVRMVQFECFVVGGAGGRGGEDGRGNVGADVGGGKGPAAGAPVVCRPVERLFRRCKDRNGSFTVETTAWEGAGGAK